MIILTNVVKMYPNGKRAVNDCSLTISEGENVLITGPVGSGKTTLMRLMAGCEPLSAGSIVVDGREIHAMSSDSAAAFRNKTFGILLKAPGFIGTLTVLEHIALPLAIRKMPARERNRAALEQMKSLGIAHLEHARPHQLSGLETKLVCLARALVTQPKILLMDSIDADLTKKEKSLFPFDTIWRLSELTLVRFSDNTDEWLYDRRINLRYGRITEGT